MVVTDLLGASGESNEIFITCLCKILCRPHDDQRPGSFLKQRIAMTVQIGACVLGTVRYVRRILIHIVLFVGLTFFFATRRSAYVALFFFNCFVSVGQL